MPLHAGDAVEATVPATVVDARAAIDDIRGAVMREQPVTASAAQEDILTGATVESVTTTTADQSVGTIVAD
jgi:hypothetical protein